MRAASRPEGSRFSTTAAVRASSVPSAGRGEVVRISSAAAETLRAFLSAPFDAAKPWKGITEISALAGLARRHFLGHELKSQRVLAEVLGH